METRTLLLDGETAITITLPAGLAEDQWEAAFNSYLLPPGNVEVVVADAPETEE